MSTSESLEDWEVVDLSTLLHELKETPAKLDEDFEYLKPRNELKAKVERALRPSMEPQDLKVHQRSTPNPVRESMVAKLVQAIEQAVLSEAENLKSYEEGVAAHKKI